MREYQIDKAQGGLLQTSFICSYMILSPVFGYLGDRYNRKLIVVIGVAIWSSVTLGSSFVPSNVCTCPWEVKEDCHHSQLITHTHTY